MLWGLFVNLIANLALVTAFLFFSDRFLKHSESNRVLSKYKLTVGAAHGLFGILLMFFSVPIDSNTFLDFRQIAIIAAAHFGGFYASLISGILIAAGRISLFGGVNVSSMTATTTVLIMGIGSGLISQYVQDYWKKWYLSISLCVIVICGSMVFLLGNDRVVQIAPFFIALIVVGGLFTAYLIRYLWKANQLVQQVEQSEARYRQLHILHEAILHSATEMAIVVTDVQGRITIFNSGAERMLGYQAEELIGKHTPALFHLADDLQEHVEKRNMSMQQEANAFEVLIAAARNGQTTEREWTYVLKNGNAIKVDLIISPVKENYDHILGFMFMATDITLKKQSEERLLRANEMLHQLTLLDGLTQIPNRRSMDESLSACWEFADRSSQPISLIMIDIDCFKSYNDTYGHLGGDQCLKQVAKTIQSTIRINDLVARYGGEEFAVVLPSTTLEEAEKLAEEIRARVEQLHIPHSGSVSCGWVTVSLGVSSIIPHSGVQSEQLICTADKALYLAKQEGRNRVAKDHTLIFPV
ncbi:diguanylate cyclase [Paenibacillus radicis (ex Xue et al. 2023)]|uniref:Diguanylate cyclase n=1 Tax=Paenibacillus radicis (ex Xue et al. 2023) TaxID=2972489 RepID=A0ABT1YF60_9BACL|nr:diguanylate cyclase [Paenibacillus radicis (ex Xue et al. 2023)]MCR8631819.1 diguanylate cyclase [Paenibacillus radicis (ex Xue et al. 2023)]